MEPWLHTAGRWSRAEAAERGVARRSRVARWRPADLARQPKESQHARPHRRSARDANPAGDGLRHRQRLADVLRGPRLRRHPVAPAARRSVQHRPAVRRAAAEPGRGSPGDRRRLPRTRAYQRHRPTAHLRRPGVRRRRPAAAPAGGAGRRLRVQRRRRASLCTWRSGIPNWSAS